MPECAYLHDLDGDCPQPETGKQYERTKDGVSDFCWYCDEAAQQAIDEGYALRRVNLNGDAP
jgi:hypothetical protein